MGDLFPVLFPDLFPVLVPDALRTPAVMLCLIVLVPALIACLVTDLKRFEIHLEALGVASGAVVLLIGLLSGVWAVIAALSVALLLGTLATILHRLRPGRMGAGDPWIFAALGLFAGPDHILPTVLVCAVASLLVAGTYSIRRGKRLFRSAFPAAVAVVPAMTGALLLRWQDVTGWHLLDTDALRLSLSPDTALQMLVISGSLLLGFGLGVRTSRASLPTSLPQSSIQKG